MSNTHLWSGAERSYSLPHAGPGARFTESVAAVLVGYGYARIGCSADRAALESALGAFLYYPLEIRP
ncbi:hypothetical protein [Streptomyces sp. NBC_00568]|uniref:hypothetical protein n=1 Tax=Streptomyces sp. NBC_00568 TaxID=2975779 RepID=UPI002257DFAD|nr:hypothetical protein [Streptomyces sp. NBC_00568]MCX4989867.1 hypothetical protein [Streptomyces sp. NBC_00568]